MIGSSRPQPPDAGLALIAAVILITVLALLVGILSRLAISTYDLTTEFASGMQAYYLAEAAAEVVMAQTNRHDICASGISPASFQQSFAQVGDFTIAPAYASNNITYSPNVTLLTGGIALRPRSIKMVWTCAGSLKLYDKE